MLRTLLLVALAAPAAAEPGDAGVGASLFRSFCAVCHGAGARGDGPMAELIKLPPADLTKLSASNGGGFPVFRVVRQIDGRDPLLAHGGDMPLFGQFFEATGVAIATESGQPILTSQPIADLTAFLMKIQE